MAEQFVGPCRLTARHGTTSSNLISSSGESVACFGPVIGFFAGYATRSDMSSPPAPKTEPWLLECRSLAQHGTEPSPGPFLGVGRTPPVVLPVTARSALHHRGSPRRLVAPPIVQLHRARRRMFRHRRGLFERAAVRAERIAVRAWPPARRTPVPSARARQSCRAPSEVCPTPTKRSPRHRHRDSASDRRS